MAAVPLGRLHLASEFDADRSVLRLTVVCAQGLLASSRTDTEPSAYVSINLRQYDEIASSEPEYNEVRTPVAELNANPEFHFTCEFFLNHALQQGAWRLHIEVWDNIQVSKEVFLGGLSFSLFELQPPAGPPSGWFALLDREDGEIRNVPVAPSFSAQSSSSTVTGVLMEVTSPISIRWADLVNPSDSDHLSPFERRRQEVIFELISTEQSYLDDLNLVMRVYDKNAFGASLSTAEHTLLIGQFDPLRRLSLALLDDLITRQQNDNMIVSGIGDILQAHIPHFLSFYSTFCDSNTEAQHLVAQKSKRDASFARICDQCRAQCRNLDILSFRLKPMQRVTRYPLLLKEIQKLTPESARDYLYLAGALESCQAIVTELNERVRVADFRRLMHQLATRLVIPDKFKPFEVQAPGRALMQMSTVQRVKLSKLKTLPSTYRHGADSKSLADFVPAVPAQLYLFSDQGNGPFLLITQDSEGAETLRVQPLPLSSIEISLIPAAEPTAPQTDILVTFKHYSGKYVDLALRLETAASCTQWLSKLAQEQRAALLLPVASKEAIAEVIGYAQELRARVTLTDVERKLLKAAGLVEVLVNQQMIARESRETLRRGSVPTIPPQQLHGASSPQRSIPPQVRLLTALERASGSFGSYQTSNTSHASLLATSALAGSVTSVRSDPYPATAKQHARMLDMQSGSRVRSSSTSDPAVKEHPPLRRPTGHEELSGTTTASSDTMPSSRPTSIASQSNSEHDTFDDLVRTIQTHTLV